MALKTLNILVGELHVGVSEWRRSHAEFPVASAASRSQSLRVQDGSHFVPRQRTIVRIHAHRAWH